MTEVESELAPAKARLVSWAHGRAAGDAFAACSMFLFLSAAIDETDGSEHVVAFALCGVATAALAGASFSLYRGHRTLRDRDGFNVIPLTWLTMIAVSTVAYLAAGAADTFDQALHESVAGFTTTNSSVLPELESLGRGVLFWRAATQWMGGLGALIVMAAVLPRVTGTREFVERTGLRQSIAPSTGAGLRNFGLVYSTVTAVEYLLYEFGGLGSFDAIAHAMTTVSTGGFSTRAASIPGFESDTVIWVSIVGMIIAGLSTSMLFWLARGAVEPLLRSVELRVYALVLLVGSLLVFSTADELEFRDSLFTVASLVTTTGFVPEAGILVSSGAIVLLLLLAVCGAMGGSPSGGLGLNRVIAIVQIARRELTLELNPHAVVALKGDGRVYRNRTVDFLVGLEILVAVLVMVGAFGLAIFDFDLLGALAAAVGYVTTTGGPLLSATGVTGHSGLGDAVSMVLMFIGRLAILPVLVAVFTARFNLVQRHRR